MPRSTFDFEGTTEAQIAADPDITFTRPSDAGRFLDSGLFAMVGANDLPRVDHHPDSGVWRGMLYEERARTNHSPKNDFLDLSSGDVQTVTATADGRVEVVSSNEVGIDGTPSALSFVMDEINDRCWQSNLVPDGFYPLVSFYCKRGVDPAPIGMGQFSPPSTYRMEAVATPASGFGQIGYRSAQFAYDPTGRVRWADNRNHPAGPGPVSFIGDGFMTEFENIGRYNCFGMYIPAAAAPVTRAAERMTLAVNRPDGRYNIVVTGDESGRMIYVDQDIRGGVWHAWANPCDIRIKKIEILGLTDPVPDGGPTIVRRTVGYNGDYPDWPSAVAALPASLVAVNEVWWFVQLPGTQEVTNQLVFNTVTDGLHPLIISSADYGYAAASNKELWHLTQNRTRLTRGTGQAIDLRCDYAQVRGMKVQGLKTSNASVQGDAKYGLITLRDCFFDRVVNQNEGGAYTEAINCIFRGANNQGIFRAGGTMQATLYHCLAIYDDSVGGSAVIDGLQNGARINCVAANYFPGSCLQFGYKENCATTDDSGAPAALRYLTYGQIFANAFPDPTPAAGLDLLGTGNFYPQAAVDIRGEPRPTANVHIGPASDTLVTDESFPSIAAALLGGRSAIVSKNLMQNVAAFGDEYWDDSTQSAVRGFDGDWYSSAVVPLPGGGFKIQGHGGGHSGYNGVEGYQFSTLDRKWTRYEAEARRRQAANDATFGSNLVFPNTIPYTLANDAHFDVVPGITEAFHCYGGGNGNPAWFQGTGNTHGYLLFVPSSVGPLGNGAFGNRACIIDLDTGLWVKAWSAQNGEVLPSVGTGGKAFVDTDNNDMWYFSATNHNVLKANLDLLPPNQFQTGAGQPSRRWFQLQGVGSQRTGLDGGACFWPGNARALAWQPSVNLGDDWAWIDISSGNPVFVPITPGGDVPSDGSLFGLTGVWVPTEGRMFMYSGREIWSFDPATLTFTNRTPSQLGADLKAFLNGEPAGGSSKARLGWLPTEQVLVLGGESANDVMIFAPAVPSNLETDLSVAAAALFLPASVARTTATSAGVASSSIAAKATAASVATAPGSSSFSPVARIASSLQAQGAASAVISAKPTVEAAVASAGQAVVSMDNGRGARLVSTAAAAASLASPSTVRSVLQATGGAVFSAAADTLSSLSAEGRSITGFLARPTSASVANSVASAAADLRSGVSQHLTAVGQAAVSLAAKPTVAAALAAEGRSDLHITTDVASEVASSGAAQVTVVVAPTVASALGAGGSSSAGFTTDAAAGVVFAGGAMAAFITPPTMISQVSMGGAASADLRSVAATSLSALGTASAQMVAKSSIEAVFESAGAANSVLPARVEQIVVPAPPVELVVRQILVSNTEVRALVDTRIYPQSLPQAPNYPAVVYQLVTDVPDYHFGGSAFLGTPRVQFDLYAEDYRDLTRLKQAVVFALSGFRGEVEVGSPAVKGRVQGAFKIFESEGLEASLTNTGQTLRRKTIDFNLVYEEAV